MTKNDKMELLILYEQFIYTFRHSEFVVDGHAEKVRKIIVESINATPVGDSDGNHCHRF